MDEHKELEEAHKANAEEGNNKKKRSRTRSRRRKWRLLTLKLALLGVVLFLLANLRTFLQLLLVASSSSSLSDVAIDELEFKPPKPKPKGEIIRPQPKQRQRQRRRVQTIVILPGPHKTGTTSVQTELSDWFYTHHKAFQDWSWPIPSQQTLLQYTNGTFGKTNIHPHIKFHQAKGHALLANRLMGKIHYHSLVSSTAIIEAYRKTLQMDWESGKNIVIAAEDLDSITIEEPITPQQKQWWKDYQSKNNQTSTKTIQQLLWDRIYDILPSHPTIRRKIVVGILYRKSRSDHLISLWHQQERSREKKGKTLSEFILHEGSWKAKATMINTWKIAQIIITAAAAASQQQQQQGGGNNVPKAAMVVDDIYVLNTAGVAESTNSLGMVVACEILKVPCHQRNTTTTKTAAGGSGSGQKQTMQTKTKTQWYLQGDLQPTWVARKNVITDRNERDLNLTTLRSINEILQQYDCQIIQRYLLLLQHSRHDDFHNNLVPTIHYLYFDDDDSSSSCLASPNPPPSLNAKEEEESVITHQTNPNHYQQQLTTKTGGLEPAFLPTVEKVMELTCQAVQQCK